MIRESEDMLNAYVIIGGYVVMNAITVCGRDNLPQFKFSWTIIPRSLSAGSAGCRHVPGMKLM